MSAASATISKRAPVLATVDAGSRRMLVTRYHLLVSSEASIRDLHFTQRRSLIMMIKTRRDSRIFDLFINARQIVT